jgi:isopenicillin N synthase-like dioxygenase
MCINKADKYIYIYIYIYEIDQVINHGVPESLTKAMTHACGEFFNLTEEEKREFGGKHVLDSIRCGTSFHASVDKVLFWRDFLKVFVHPQFHSPTKPAAFRYILLLFSYS